MKPLSPAQKSDAIDSMCRFVRHGHAQGICLDSVDGERLTLRLPYREELVGNPETGAIHSGVLTVLLDQTLGFAAICCDRLGAVLTPTLDLRIDHLGVAPAGRDIFATAWVYRVTRSIVFVEGYAYWESRDRPIARATGCWVPRPDIDLSSLLGAVELQEQALEAPPSEAPPLEAPP